MFLRRCPVFHTSLCKINYVSNSCINRVCKRGNFLGHRLDFFRESLPAFKKSVKSTRNAEKC